MRQPLAGRVVLVAGASRGVGAEVAGLLADAGAEVAVCARSHGALNAVAAGLVERGAEATPFAADLTDPAARADVVRAVVARFGRLDGLISAVGSGPPGTLADADAGRVRAATEADFFAPVELLRVCHPALAESAQAGRRPGVVFVGQAGGRAADAGGRAALKGLAQAVRIEFARYDIGVAWVDADRGPAAVVRALAAG